jgi:hypothetical protein
MNTNVIIASVLVLICLFALQKLIGSRWAAFTACMPITSGPLIIAATINFGVPVAQQILLGCIVATGAASLSLFVFGRLRNQSIAFALLIALVVFALIVYVQQHLNNLAEVSAALAFSLILLTMVISGRSVPVPNTSLVRLNRGSVLIPCLILTACLAAISILPPTWSGVLAASPLISLSFLIGLRRSGNSPQTILNAISASRHGLLTKLVLFCTAYLLLQTQLSWITAYLITVLVTIAYFLLTKIIAKYFNQPYYPSENKHPLATNQSSKLIVRFG